MVVLARGLPIDHILSRANHSVAARRATGADALGFLQEPDTHLETKIGGGERAYRANIDGVKGIIIFQSLAGMCSQHRITAPINEPKHVFMRNFLTKANAARAENAAFVIERNTRAEHDVFRLLDLVFEKARFAPAKINAELLQPAFPSLIANRTIQRMINEKKFHHTALAFLH